MTIADKINWVNIKIMLDIMVMSVYCGFRDWRNDTRWANTEPRKERKMSMALYESKFNLHQEVWAISHETFRRIVKCKVCAQTGKVTIKEDEYVCPKCDGRSTHPVWEGQKWFVEHFAAEVGKITIQRTIPHEYRDESRDDTNQYMLVPTGIGSGSVWYEEYLFATLEEAQADCDRRNGVLCTEDYSHLTLPAAV